ncbi:GGDEF domain-containing protein [Sphingobium yanoikuyae]|uniref:diguanylate cyclase n=1 Tax=Sphingobium yanoikuyae TaxID=13690 RepID=A0A291N605_SPHYA|nr:GGDEF domain-containing protein [Sphingobium yanoikuyae]ATI82538.1 GGDEF domain-containing protein [Sphingobium yanoikuyae]
MNARILIRGLSRHGLAICCAMLSIALLILGGAQPARAELLRIGDPLCHAVSRSIAPDDTRPSHFVCNGDPDGYQKGTLWLHAALPQGSRDHEDLSLIIHSSRFDRLVVRFIYRDGAVEQQHVRSGNFGTYWRAGGQLAFRAPYRDVPVVAYTLRFDKVASAHLLRMRLVERGEEATQTTGLATLTGAALVLLIVGAIYNASLALAVRQQHAGWQAAWAFCMVIWGAFWSQLHLFFFPSMAGAVSAQICTGLSCLAITLATLSAVTALEKQHLDAGLRRTALGLTASVCALGIPLSLMRSGPFDMLGNLLGFLVLANLAAVASCIGQAWRRGSSAARSLGGAWALPMIVLASTSFFDADAMFWGGGSQILVLFAAAWQTLWLSAAASRAHARLRMERDVARLAEAKAHELARRDVLTGLPNRRGFMERTGRMLEGLPVSGGLVALLLIDVDWFKSINDVYGHEAGDHVLAAIGRCIAQHENSSCAVCRLGGEEFAMMVTGAEVGNIEQFAQTLRGTLADLSHGDIIGNRMVTVSIGVTASASRADFGTLYRLADEALYDAKRGGRDQIAIRLDEWAGARRNDRPLFA